MKIVANLDNDFYFETLWIFLVYVPTWSSRSCTRIRGSPMVCGRIATPNKRYPFEVEISDDSAVRGAILADQVRSLDWKTRPAKKKSKASNEIVEATLALIRTLID